MLRFSRGFLVTALAVVSVSCGEASEPSPAAKARTTAAPEPSAALQPLELPSGPHAITPSFSRAGEDLLYLWQEPDPGPGTEGQPERWRVRFARRQAGAWSAPVDLARGEDILANWADFPSVGVAGDGSLVAHWFQTTADAYTFNVARSTDGGSTWVPLSSPFPAGLPGERGFVSYAAEPGGLRVFWLDGRELGSDHHGAGQGATALRSALLGKDGFSAEEVVDARVCDCCATDAVVASGRPVVVYRDRDEAERRDVAVASAAAGGWSSGLPVGADGWTIEGCPVNGPAADARGAKAVAAWFSGARDQQAVRAAFSTDGGATFGPAITVAQATTEARPLGRVDVLLEDSGDALVSWLSAEGEDAGVRVRRVASDGRQSAPVALGASSTARSAGFPRLGWEGARVVAAWTAPGGGNAVVAFDPAFVPAVTASTPAQEAPPALTGLPDFEARDLAGSPVRAADLRGRPVLLNVWATWCEPCREELPMLDALQAAHPELRVLALSVDGAAAGPSVRKMAEKRAPGLTVLHPDEGLASRLGVSALPRTFLFDGGGRLVWSSTGAFQAEDPAFAAALARLGGR